MTDCIFCKIVRGEIPKEKEMETDNLIVFNDIKPKAPIHFLIVSKKHIESVLETDDTIWLDVKNVVSKLSEKLDTSGFRLVTNAKAAAEVKHMHVHFLGEVGLDREL